MGDPETMCRPERMAPLLRGPERDAFAFAGPVHIRQNAHLDGGVRTVPGLPPSFRDASVRDVTDV
jgi:hypothetical protein